MQDQDTQEPLNDGIPDTKSGVVNAGERAAMVSVPDG
jgi:hypothetical protein